MSVAAKRSALAGAALVALSWIALVALVVALAWRGPVLLDTGHRTVDASCTSAVDDAPAVSASVARRIMRACDWRQTGAPCAEDEWCAVADASDGSWDGDGRP